VRFDKAANRVHMDKLRLMACGAVAVLALSTAPSQAQVFTYIGGTVTWTVPVTGTYRVTAFGAQGASGGAQDASANTTTVGGRGAQVAGTFNFAGGEMYYIAVGGIGQGQDRGNNGGGGGGTFLVDLAGTPLLIAGGGGGTRVDAAQNGTDASITQYGTTSSGFFPAYVPQVKTTDLGLGGSAAFFSWGSGGAGFYGNGASDAPFGTGGSSWANGLAGGVNVGCSGVGVGGAGGFGGGGAGAGCDGGGGGGGYSGGDGGWVAGGGGSFNAGTDQFALAGVGFGNGLLRIEPLVVAVPGPIASAGLPALLGIFSAWFYRRRRSEQLNANERCHEQRRVTAAHSPGS
jgi:hypothetical protein